MFVRIPLFQRGCSEFVLIDFCMCSSIPASNANDPSG